MQPHLPPGVRVPEHPVAVRPLLAEVGEAAGHRLLLLSIEDWGHGPTCVSADSPPPVRRHSRVASRSRPTGGS